MDVFFPRAERPEEPCKVRVFEDSATFLAWRDRGKSLDTHSLWVTAIADFFLAENAIILADFHDSDQGIATKAEQYRQRLRERLDSARDPADLLRLEIAVGALAHSFAIQDREKIAVTLDWFLHGEDDDSSAGRTPPRAPRADPTEGGEATFINYGYYSSATEELVLWKSDEFWTTVSHETFHYFLEHNCPEAPIWINEGFATYFETFSPLQRDKFQGFHFDRWGELKTGPERGVPFVGLDDLLLVDIGTWQAQEGPLQSYLYAESWAFLHFLLHSDEFDFGNKGRKLLIGYLELLSDGKSPEEAMKESFTGEFSLETLEPKFMNYVNRLKRPDW
jgi:hypothetical protein